VRLGIGLFVFTCVKCELVFVFFYVLVGCSEFVGTSAIDCL